MASHADLSSSELLSLWMLNETTAMPASVARLVVRSTEQWQSQWDFPGSVVFESSHDDRILAIARCINEGWLAVYAHSASASPRMISSQGFSNRHAKNLRDLTAVITEDGHRHWDELFAPDWDLFWRVEHETFDSSGNIVEVFMVCGSARRADELFRLFPAYYGIRESHSLSDFVVRPTFAYHAAIWKVLPVAFIVQLCFDTSGGSDQCCCAPPRSSFNKPTATFCAATRDLVRFSKRWRMIDRGSDWRNAKGIADESGDEPHFSHIP